ncbi:TatD DNase family protein [Arcicella rosea]|uniref:Qat anti-phage system TatD family nuclease QatD n=1 Tax=Arcicella rosea TaxID=502909 RepID=UPI00345CA3B0
MIIDTHCHIDLYSNPHLIANECEKEGIIVIGMTNLPSHFEMGFPHLLSFKKVRLALGLHPLYAENHLKEYGRFMKNLEKTSYIGEVGLDFSKEGIATKEIQIESFNFILNAVTDKKKVLSIHSRQAEKETLELLIKYNISNAIFHWYSGSVKLIDKIIDSGYYFSINPAMIGSKSGQAIIKAIPKENVLTESDGPFIEVQKRVVHSNDIKYVIDYLSKLWNVSYEETETIIYRNFRRIIDKLR